MKEWKPTGAKTHWLYEVCRDGDCYVWDHGLCPERHYSWRAISESAAALLDNTIDLQRRSHSRPVIFIAHSLGGSIVKQVENAFSIAIDSDF